MRFGTIAAGAMSPATPWSRRVPEDSMWRDSVERLTRHLPGRRGLLLLAVPLILAGCVPNLSAGTTLGDVVWSMLAFFFWFMAIWIFITIFGDIFRRDDLTGGMKAVWIFVLIILPFLGALIYIATRPKLTAQDVQLMTQAEAASKAAASVSPADQIAKLSELRAAGAITEEEFQALKAKALG
jgi:hypothetical protein